eukprot:UN31790
MFEDLDRKGEYWRLRRFGPFTTTGGGDWINNVYSEDHLTPRWFTGRHFARYYSDGEPMGFLPFHVHHEHVGNTVNVPGLFGLEGVDLNRQFVAHADDVCPKGKGGLDCMLHKSYPEGYGQLLPGNKAVYDSVFQDMRQPNSEPIEWYSEIALRYTFSKRKRLMLRTSVNDGGLFKYLRIDVPDKKYSMFWYSFKMQTDGHFLSLWCHNHGFESVYAIASHPDDINMNKYKKPNEHD